ncbi:T9SS type A sorting domain-containing protein [Chryseolinea sp. H1M3-3]|uniref:Ig-like domain-containing protein n=1 Tax=Chryseolinea sp. H1M3-3 TaxID=3034144 RepID=UPI0023ED5DFC|nr:T9SS type A sorting domain-containing protein [Chryseolinea sp. H1M3-3]
MKKAVLALFFCLSAGFVLGQSNGWYRSRQSGNWNQASTWQVYNNSGWKDLETPSAGGYRNILPSYTSNIIIISASNTVTVPDGFEVFVDQMQFGSNAVLQVASDGILSILNGVGNDLRLYNDGVSFAQLQNNGLVRLHSGATIVNDNYAGTILPASHSTTFNTYKVLNGGIHIHASNDGIPYADWQTGSTIAFFATNASPVIDDVSIQFYNFVWDGRSQAQDLSFSGKLRNVNGSLTINKTNGYTLSLGTSGNYTLNIGGNLSVLDNSSLILNTSATSIVNIGSVSTPGNFDITAGTVFFAGTGSTTVAVTGDYTMSGGTVSLRTQTSAGSGTTSLNIQGDFIQTAGTITRAVGGGFANVNFTGAGTTSAFSKTGGVITNAINFGIASGKTLDLGTSALTGSGALYVYPNANVHIRSLDAGGAIQNNATGGNIRLTGTRTFVAGSSVIYDGAGAQFIGSGHPITANTTINNTNNVSLVGNVTINGALNQVEGVLLIGSNTLTLGGAYSRTNGYFGISTLSNVVINGSGNFGDLLLSPVQFPNNPMNNLTINRSGGTVFLGNSLIVGGAFTQTNGTFSLGQFSAYTLTLRGNYVQSGSASLAVFDNSTLVVEGTGSLPTNVNIAGPNLFSLTMNRPAATFTSSSPLTLTNLNLFNGVVNNPSFNITMAPNGLVTRYSGGSITQVLGAISSYDVLYDIATDITTGNELPFTSPVTTRLGNLTKQGTGLLTLNHDIVVNKTFNVLQGSFDIGTNNDVAIGEDLLVAGTLLSGESKVSFIGAAPQQIDATTPLTLFDLEVNQTTTSTVALSAGTNLDIQNSLAINSGSVFNAGNEQLRLLSTPTRTANVNQLPSGASITGSVIVQRYLPKVVAREGFHYLASPVSNATLADWDVELPLDKSYRWNEPTQAWAAITSGTALTSGRGFLIYVNATSTFTYDSRGILGQGNVNVPVTSTTPIVNGYEGLNLVGNPYPSAIDWDNMTLPPAIYNAVYLRDNYGNSGQGTEPDILVSYVDGIGTPSGYGGTIAQGQSFFVYASANATLTFTEAAKTSVTNTQFYKKGEIPNVLRIVLNGNEIKDEAVIRLREGATDQFDGQFDAYKVSMQNKNAHLSSLTSDNIKAVINALGTAECNKIIPLVTEGMQQGTYTLNFVGMESFDSFINIGLLDVVEKKRIDIRSQKEYSFTVNDQNIDLLSSRFQIAIEGSTATINNTIAASGESVCSDKSTAIITLESSEPGVTYSAELNGARISEPVSGTGSLVQLIVNTSALSAGENNVTIRAQSGVCSAAPLTAKPVITKLSAGEIRILQSGAICGSGSATLKVAGASKEGWYQWYNSQDDLNPIAGHNDGEFVTPHLAKSKTYYVSAVNSQGCEGARVPVQAIVSNLEDLTLSAEGNILTSGSETGNQWYLNDELIEGATSNTLEALEPGLYTVQVNSGACSKRASLEITGMEGEIAVNIYPNPTQNKVFIRVKSANNNVTATLVNTQGIEIGTKPLMGDGSVKEGEFDLLSYATGIYNIRILDGKKVIVKKIAKIK